MHAGLSRRLVDSGSQIAAKRSQHHAVTHFQAHAGKAFGATLTRQYLVCILGLIRNYRQASVPQTSSRKVPSAATRMLGSEKQSEPSEKQSEPSGFSLLGRMRSPRGSRYLCRDSGPDFLRIGVLQDGVLTVALCQCHSISLMGPGYIRSSAAPYSLQQM